MVVWCPNMLWVPNEIAAEAERRTRMGDAQAVLRLLDADVQNGCSRYKVWENYKTEVLRGVMRSYHGETHGFPEQVFRALMGYTSPEGGMFYLKPLGRHAGYELRWGKPPHVGFLFALWTFDADKALDEFARAWISETTAWSMERAAWVAAVVCGAVEKRPCLFLSCISE